MKRKHNKEFWRLLGRAVIAWETIKKMEEYKKTELYNFKI
jgi:predicted metal-dependent hydrolase